MAPRGGIRCLPRGGCVSPGTWLHAEAKDDYRGRGAASSNFGAVAAKARAIEAPEGGPEAGAAGVSCSFASATYFRTPVENLFR